jgi:formamidopyrimidine-DNA glycosylase
VPELPEVETIRGQLAPLVERRVLERVEIVDPRWSRPLAPAELAAALVGRRVESLDRRGKYLLWNLSGDVHLVQHLRMTGAVLLEPRPEPPHVSARLDFGRGRRLVVVDPRRFGTASSRSANSSRLSACARWRAGGSARSSRSCSISATSRESATSTPTRRCFEHTCIPCVRPGG